MSGVRKTQMQEEKNAERIGDKLTGFEAQLRHSEIPKLMTSRFFDVWKMEPIINKPIRLFGRSGSMKPQSPRAGWLAAGWIAG